MSFSAQGLYENLQSSFSQTGFDDLIEFLLRQKETRRWIIASDFNLGSPGAAHNVFAFAAYPTGERNYLEEMKAALSEERGVVVSITAISRRLHRLGLSHKKSR